MEAENAELVAASKAAKITHEKKRNAILTNLIKETREVRATVKGVITMCSLLYCQ